MKMSLFPGCKDQPLLPTKKITIYKSLVYLATQGTI